MRELIGDVLVAPVQPWDALICTSPAVRECLEGLLDRWQAHLSNRFRRNRAPRPQLPLVPLGVDQSHLLQQRADQHSRNYLRRHLRLKEQDVLVLWLGRLSFFEKAYPQGMFISLQKAPNDVDGVSISLWRGGSPVVTATTACYRGSGPEVCPDGTLSTTSMEKSRGRSLLLGSG